jgi:serine/threonine protein kinase
MSFERAGAILRELAQALAEVHKQGIIHRDIKPENILLRGDGTAVPAGASVRTEHEQTPVGLDGLVYLSEAAGTQQAVAEWVGGHRCEFTFTRAAGTDPVPDLGTIACREFVD